MDFPTVKTLASDKNESRRMVVIPLNNENPKSCSGLAPYLGENVCDLSYWKAINSNKQQLPTVFIKCSEYSSSSDTTKPLYAPIMAPS